MFMYSCICCHNKFPRCILLPSYDIYIIGNHNWDEIGSTLCYMHNNVQLAVPHLQYIVILCCFAYQISIYKKIHILMKYIMSPMIHYMQQLSFCCVIKVKIILPFCKPLCSWYNSENFGIAPVFFHLVDWV